MFRKRILLLLIFTCAYTGVINSQEILGQPQFEYSSKAPEKAALQKMIDFPISPFTGSANISIPLHTVKTKAITLPIGLQYSGGGGIKVEDKGGIVGVGWNFFAGGSITRVVRGNEDEGVRYNYSKHKIPTSTSPFYMYVYRTEKDSLATLYNKYGGYYVDGGVADVDVPGLYASFSYHDSLLKAGDNPLSYNGYPFYYNGLTDTEPDMFYFNFGDYSGKFIFKSDKTAMLIPYNADIKITTVIKDSSDYQVNYDQYGIVVDTSFFRQFFFQSFKVSTPDGKDYYFGESQSSRVANPYNHKPNMYNGWQLTRIVDRASMDTVYLDYTASQRGNSYIQRKQKFVKPSEDIDGCQNNGGGTNSLQTEISASITKIRTTREEIEFYYGTEKLDSFRVLNAQSRLPLKKIQFSYGKFNSDKIKLEGVVEKDLVTKKFLPYTFGYYDTTGTNSPLAQDFWGYYNGANNSNLMISYRAGCTGGDRYSAWPAMKREVLTSVTYPTGGRTMFEYEPHRAYTGRNLSNSIVEGDAFVVYHGTFSLNDMIGGLRIKRVKKYDPIFLDSLTTEYSYQNFTTTNSSGHLYIPPSLKVDVSSFACYPAGSPTYYLSTHNMYIGADANQHVSYNQVTVKETKNGIDNGRIEYEYYDDTNTDSSFYSNAITASSNAPLTGPYDLYPSWQFKRLPENFLSGKEKEKRIYNSAGQLLERQKSEYKSAIYPSYEFGLQTNTIFEKDICNAVIPIGDGGGNNLKWTPFYFTDGGVGVIGVLAVNDTAQTYNGGGVRPVLPPPYSYYFMYRYQMAKINVQLAKQIKQSYTSDGSTSSDTTTFLFENSDHINSTMSMTRNSKNEVRKQQTLYNRDFSDINSGDSTFYFMRKANINIPVATFSYINDMAVSGGFRKYQYKSRQDSTTYLPFEEYALNSSNAGYSMTTLGMGTGFPKSFAFSGGYFNKVASYQYNTDNTIKYAVKKGKDRIHLIWDYQRSLSTAQVSGTDTTDFAFTSFEAENSGNWTIGSSTRTSSGITGTKAYSLSNGSITRSGLISSKTYIVSYWSSSTAATIASTTAVAGVSKRGWQYYEHQLPASATSVTISGSVTIDELRLYPKGSIMSTSTFDPALGVTSITGADNSILYYEYDGSGKLRFIRDVDRNIIKAADYFYTGFGADTAVWRTDGTAIRYKPCPSNNSYSTGIIQYESIDINPNSSTFGQLQWKDISGSTNTGAASWENTATAMRCVKNGSNENTGVQEREQKDMNPCSSTYNTLRWVTVGTNYTSCPLPCVGNDKMVIGGVCTTGTKVYTASVWSPSEGKWSCKYHYEWPGCIKSIDYYEYKTSSCATASGCVPD